MASIRIATAISVKAIIRASRPSFRNSHDKVAFVVHASFLACGFVLTATGLPAFADNALTSSSSDEVGIEGWNEVEDEYAFVYVNPEKPKKKVLMKCLVMCDKLMVNAVSDGASDTSHFEINVDEYVAETDATDYNAQYKNLAKLVTSLLSDFLINVITLHVISTRSSNEPNRNIDGSGSSEISPMNSLDSNIPRFVLPPVSPVGGSYPYPSGGAGMYPSRFVLPPVSPVGGCDLYPSGGAGTYPSRGGFGGGLMFVGPVDPIFGVPGGPGGFSGLPPGARFDPYGPPPAARFVPYGPPPGARFDPYGPPPAARFVPYGPPPGARFDPYGPPPGARFVPYGPPPGVPGFEPGRFVRFPRGRTPDP